MWKNITLKNVIATVKLSLFINCSWPLPTNTIKLKVVCVALYQYLCLFLTLGLTIGLCNTVRNHLDDPIIMAKSIMVICPTMHIMCNIVFCKINSYRLQLVTYEMENFCELLNSHEETIVQQYIDRCVHFYGGSILWLYLSAIFIITGPVTLDQPFPTNAEYPFDIYHQPMKFIIFVHQAIVCMQCASQLCTNVFIALLLWFTSVRFELLAEELRTIIDVHDLLQCIQKHQKLLKYADEVVTVVRPFALTAISISTLALIIVGIILITQGQSLSMKIQCICLIFGGLSEVFMYTWPSEHLIHISSEVGQAAFNTQWYKLSIAIQKSLQIIMQKGQKPIVVAIPCLMPSLSLNYYASYLSTIFSFFTTLRMVIQNSQDGE